MAGQLYRKQGSLNPFTQSSSGLFHPCSPAPPRCEFRWKHLIGSLRYQVMQMLAAA